MGDNNIMKKKMTSQLYLTILYLYFECGLFSSSNKECYIKFV